MSVPTIGKSGDPLVALSPAPPGPTRETTSTAAPVPQPQAQQSPQPSQADVEKASKAIKEKLQSMSIDNLEFSVDGSTGQLVTRITDSKTGDLIRQMPSKEMLAIAQDLDRLKGLLIQQQA